MSIYRVLAVLFVINLCLFPARAQSTGAIEGTVIDAETQAPLPGVNVSVEGTQRGAATDTKGAFVIQDVPAGTHTLRAQFVGYRTERQSVDVPAGGTVEVRLTLEPEAVHLSGIEVSARRGWTRP